MSSNVVISNITEADLDEIIQLGLQTKELQVNQGEPRYYEKRQLSSFITSPNDIYLVAKVNGEIAGYRLATFNPYLKEAYMIDIVVKEKFRHQGIGLQLYQKTMEELQNRDCDWCWTLVHEDNHHMQNFVTKFGFTQGKKFVFYHKPRPFV